MAMEPLGIWLRKLVGDRTWHPKAVMIQREGIYGLPDEEEEEAEMNKNSQDSDDEADADDEGGNALAVRASQ